MKNKNIAIISGANGQDGSYLCEFLLEKNYTVIACIRHSTSSQQSKTKISLFIRQTKFSSRTL